MDNVSKSGGATKRLNAPLSGTVKRKTSGPLGKIGTIVRELATREPEPGGALVRRAGENAPGKIKNLRAALPTTVKIKLKISGIISPKLTRHRRQILPRKKISLRDRL